MTELSKKKCLPCECGTPPLTKFAASKLLLQLNPEWEITEKQIRREFKFRDFISALSFVNRVGELAEAEGHHPDIMIRYNRVTLELTTHTISGLSENDFILASKIDQL